MSIGRLAVLGLALCVWTDAHLARAQSEVPAAAPAEAQSSPATVRIPAGAEIQMEVVQELNSRTNQPGDLFALRLAEPIIIDNVVVVPAGAVGGGEVIDAQPSDRHGIPGVLVVSGRFVELNGVRARIRGMQILRGGGDRGITAGVALVLGGDPSITRGQHTAIEAGTRATARLAVDVEVPLAGAADLQGTTP